jgi:hypothetical protein
MLCLFKGRVSSILWIPITRSHRTSKSSIISEFFKLYSWVSKQRANFESVRTWVIEPWKQLTGTLVVDLFVKKRGLVMASWKFH